jgi:3-dehydroquinate synthase
MAMADSCIGGKSSINVGSFKNLVGTFHPPRAVIIEPAFVATLSRAEVCSGLAEAAKICFCRGAGTFSEYLALASPVLAGDWSAARLTPLLRHVLATKIWFIEVDEFDNAERRLLNFGHTWGHALEASSDYAVPHGLAVAIGMLAAVEYAGVEGDAVTRLVEHTRALLRAASATPLVAGVDEARFARAFRADKKHRTESYQVIVPSKGEGLGACEISLSKEREVEVALVAALERALGGTW